ncbi:MAG TPA: antitoxin family protein [Gemmataceae bacterium]|nr:antitoxin family protein [Gemmataceae bacterium]
MAYTIEAVYENGVLKLLGMQVKDHTFKNTGAAGTPDWVRKEASCV